MNETELRQAYEVAFERMKAGPRLAHAFTGGPLVLNTVEDVAAVGALREACEAAEAAWLVSIRPN